MPNHLQLWRIVILLNINNIYSYEEGVLNFMANGYGKYFSGIIYVEGNWVEDKL